MNHGLFILSIVAAAGASSGATMTYVVQSRSITANASAMIGGVTDSESRTCSDFAPWVAGVDAQAWDTTYGVYGWGHANQDSRLEPQSIVASGGWSGGRTGQGCGGGGSSYFSAVFEIDERTGYTLSVSSMTDSVWFGGPDGFYITMPGDYSGTLMPGRYGLNASSSGGASSPPSGGGFYVTLNLVPPPPCPADLNLDRVVNTVDLVVLLSGFGTYPAPGTGADFDGDGQVNTSDLALLLGSFGQTCP